MPPKIPPSINNDDERFWAGAAVYEKSQDIRLHVEERERLAKNYQEYKDKYLKQEEVALIEGDSLRQPVTVNDPEVKHWVEATMAQCPYCLKTQLCSRLTPLPERCPACWSLVDRRAVQ